MTLDAGTHLGRYEIRSMIGAGGRDQVYLAQDVTPAVTGLALSLGAINKDLGLITGFK